MSKFGDILDRLRGISEERKKAEISGFSDDPYLADPAVLERFINIAKRFSELTDSYLPNRDLMLSGEQKKCIPLKLLRSAMAGEGVVMAAVMSGMGIGLPFPQSPEGMMQLQSSVRRASLAILIADFDRYERIMSTDATVSDPDPTKADVTDLVADIVHFVSDARVRESRFIDATKRLEDGGFLMDAETFMAENMKDDDEEEDGESWKN